jgi:6-phosphogluconolactonase
MGSCGRVHDRDPGGVWPVVDARVVISTDRAAAARAAAESFARQARDAVERAGRFTVALSGGTAPEDTYRLLGTSFRDSVPWDRVHLFWGDERCVPPGHERSNFGMAWRAMIRHLPIPPAQVHRMPGELPPEEGARRYAETLAAQLGGGVPAFDLLHLGVGADGHTCSIFPFGPLVHERSCTVAAALMTSLGEWRLTLTVPVLNAAARVEVLAHGAGKAPVVASALRGPLDPVRLPIQLVRPGAGRLTWQIDLEAAGALD